MNLKQSNDGYMGGCEGRKGKGKWCKYNLKSKRKQCQKSCILEVRHLIKQPSEANCLASWDDLS